ncbi:MAG: class II aldolase/adducin family protein [Anaerolineae bacterium]
MDFQLLPPRHQLTEIMTRVYRQGMTTVSGGNCSVRDPDGGLWITPAGIDKGRLEPDDIVRVGPDGTIEGRHRPSSEFPFHRQIYEARPDIHALVHAHPPAMVAFSIARRLPDTRIYPQSRDLVGEVGYAPYALPGSEDLGRSIAQAFGGGYHAVLLENHGVVVGGSDLLDAFWRFETLEYCAAINIRAQVLGPYRSLTDEEIRLFVQASHELPEFMPEAHSADELERRLEICSFVARAYDRRLMISTGGTVSARVSDDSFVITPFGHDRRYLEPSDLVLVNDGRAEVGKRPSRAALLHQTIYRDHPDIGSIMSAQPPHATTYSISERAFDTRTIPESYILLRDMPRIPYGLPYSHPEQVSEALRKETPVLLLQNDSVLSTGRTLLEAFDRLEVAEFSAQALIETSSIGELQPITSEELENLEIKFGLR